MLVNFTMNTNFCNSNNVHTALIGGHTRNTKHAIIKIYHFIHIIFRLMQLYHLDTIYIFWFLDNLHFTITPRLS